MSSYTLLVTSHNTPYEKIGDQVVPVEVPFDIPETWEWVTLRSVAVTELGKTLDKAKNKGELHPYLCSINVYWDGIDLSTVKQARFEETELSKYLLLPGDLLICEGGDVGRSAVWNSTREMYYQNALHRVRFYGNISPYYFLLVLECYKGNKILDQYSKGMTIKHLVQSALNSIVFPLPPLEEQHRIVQKVKEITPFVQRYDDFETELSTLNNLFPLELKKSILQWAVQGKLVPQDENDEPADVLLERIRAEKEALIKAGKIKPDKHESVIFRRDNSHYEKLGEIERCIDGELPFEIPESWQWCRFSTVIELQSGQDLLPDKYNAVGKGIPYLTGASNILDGNVIINRWTDHPRSLAHKGEILLTCKGTVGTMTILQENEVHIARQIMSVKPNQLVSTQYVRLVLDTLVDTLKASAKSMIPGISRDDVLTSLIPVPPIAEQKRIVAKIEELMPLVKTV